MKNRTDVLNHLVERFGLGTYLELGTQDREQNFNKVVFVYKKYCVDVEGASRPDFLMTTDEFFAQNKTFWDLIFIDASHYAEQVEKDFHNSYKWLKPGGFIVLHDCNPLEEWHTTVPRPSKTGHWNGDVYRFAASLQCRKYCVDVDNGCMVVPWQDQYVIGDKPSWQEFSSARKSLLNLISWEFFVKLKS